MNLPKRGIDLIKEFEGYHNQLRDGSGRVQAYADAIHGWNVPTIGYGTTKYPNGVSVRQGDIITRERAEEYLEHYVNKRIRPQMEKIPTWGQMNDNQKGAIYSFAYNLGEHFYKGSGFKSITLVCDSPNRWSDTEWVTAQFVKYRNPGTSAEAGLLRRRRAEAKLFCEPFAGQPEVSSRENFRIKCKHETYLKKTTESSDTIKARAIAGELARATIGSEYLVARVLKEDGLHIQVELGYASGIWWLFAPHWEGFDTKQDQELLGNFTARFLMESRHSSSLTYGKLVFYRGGRQALCVQATSGQAGFQYDGAWSQFGKGFLPPGKEWKINTSGYYISGSQQPGIAGMFYHITPDPHPVYGRSEIGLHRDANASYAPGSAGCIVTSTNDFDTHVMPLMAEAKKIQSQIPLEVIYS